MRRLRLFAIGILAQALLGLLSVVVTRWAFRSWPAGAYTWIPGLIGVAGVLVLVGLAYTLASRGLPFVLLAAAWLIGRLAGAVVAAVLPGVGFDPALIASASFGLLVVDGGRLAIDTPSLPSLLAQLVILSLAYLWGRRSRRQRVGPVES